MDTITDPGLREVLNGAMTRLLEQSRTRSSNHFPAILEATATAYTHEFTLDELKEFHAFAVTPAGAHYLHASVGMIGDPAVQKANAALMDDIQALQKSTLNEVIPKIIAYVKAHPATATQLHPKSTS